MGFGLDTPWSPGGTRGQPSGDGEARELRPRGAAQAPSLLELQETYRGIPPPKAVWIQTYGVPQFDEELERLLGGGSREVYHIVTLFARVAELHIVRVYSLEDHGVAALGRYVDYADALSDCLYQKALTISGELVSEQESRWPDLSLMTDSESEDIADALGRVQWSLVEAVSEAMHASYPLAEEFEGIGLRVQRLKTQISQFIRALPNRNASDSDSDSEQPSSPSYSQPSSPHEPFAFTDIYAEEQEPARPDNLRESYYGIPTPPPSVIVHYGRQELVAELRLFETDRPDNTIKALDLFCKVVTQAEEAPEGVIITDIQNYVVGLIDFYLDHEEGWVTAEEHLKIGEYVGGLVDKFLSHPVYSMHKDRFGEMRQSLRQRAEQEQEQEAEEEEDIDDKAATCAICLRQNVASFVVCQRGCKAGNGVVCLLCTMTWHTDNPNEVLRCVSCNRGLLENDVADLPKLWLEPLEAARKDEPPPPPQPAKTVCSVATETEREEVVKPENKKRKASLVFDLSDENSKHRIKITHEMKSGPSSLVQASSAKTVSSATREAPQGWMTAEETERFLERAASQFSGL